MIDINMTLDMFDGEGAGTAGPNAGADAGGKGVTEPVPEAQKRRETDKEPVVRYGKPPAAERQQQTEQAQPQQPEQTTEQQPAPDAEFTELIKGKFKDQYGAAVAQAIKNRFPEERRASKQLEKFDPMIEALAIQYGIKPNEEGRYDTDAVIKAVVDSDDWVAREAERRNLDVGTTRQLLALEREKAQRSRQDAEQQRIAAEQDKQRQRDEKYAALREASKETAAKYPGYDFEKEMANPEYAGLCAFGFSPTKAYEAVHHDEIMRGGLQYAHQVGQQQLANSIAAQGQRPRENGTSSYSTGVVWKDDPTKLTKKDRKAIKDYVRRGGVVEF